MKRKKRVRVNALELQRIADSIVRREFSPKLEPEFKNLIVGRALLNRTLYTCWKVHIYYSGISIPVGTIEFFKNGKVRLITPQEIVQKRIIKAKPPSP